MIARLLRRRTARFQAIPQALAPELEAMAGGEEHPVAGGLLPAVPGEMAQARIWARHGYLAYANTYR